MGETDIQRQQMNVERMKLLGAEACSVQKGRGTLKDAMNEALRDLIPSCGYNLAIYWVRVQALIHPTMVREFQKIIGLEARNQIPLKEINCPMPWLLVLVVIKRIWVDASFSRSDPSCQNVWR